MTRSRTVRRGDGPGCAQVSHFSIAGLTFALEAPYDLAVMGLSARYRPFLCEPGSQAPSVRIRWQEGDPDAVPQGEALFDPGELWRLSRRPEGCDGYCARVAYSEGIGRPARAAVTANADWSVVDVVEQRRGGQWKSLLSLGVGELIFRMRALFCEGLVLHASGIDDHGRGLLFVGQSGAGKSTQAAIWGRQEGVSRMGDDRVAVRLTGAGATAYGLPWGRPAGPLRNHRAALAAVLLIEQAPDSELTRLTAAQAAPLLLPRTFLPYGEESLLQRAFSTLEGLLAVVPIFRLRCRPEPEVVQLVREGLCASRTAS